MYVPFGSVCDSVVAVNGLSFSLPSVVPIEVPIMKKTTYHDIYLSG